MEDSLHFILFLFKFSMLSQLLLSWGHKTRMSLYSRALKNGLITSCYYFSVDAEAELIH